MPVWSYGFITFFCLSFPSSTSDLLQSKRFDLNKVHYKQVILKPLSTLNPAREHAVEYNHACRTGLGYEHKTQQHKAKQQKLSLRDIRQKCQSHNCPEWLGDPILKACHWVDFPILSTITYKLLITLFKIFIIIIFKLNESWISKHWKNSPIDEWKSTIFVHFFYENHSAET